MSKMYRLTKYVSFRSVLNFRAQIYQNFMVPNPIEVRLFTTMENMNIHCESWNQLVGPVALELDDKESKLKLSVEARNHGDVIVVRCQGRIVYRDEAAALSRVVGEVLHQGSKLVLDLSGVSVMDSAGIGELALLQSWAQERRAELKCVAADGVVRTLLDLTKLDSVLEVHVTLESALGSFRSQLANEFAA
jgi:anti-sigma B factor antagonist